MLGKRLGGGGQSSFTVNNSLVREFETDIIAVGKKIRNCMQRSETFKGYSRCGRAAQKLSE